MIDLTGPPLNSEAVKDGLNIQVEVRSDGKVLWVSHNGVTVLRACNITTLEIVDRRKDIDEASQR